MAGSVPARRGAAAGVFAFFLGLYALTFHGYVDIEDVEVCYQATQSLVERGTLALGDTPSAREIAREEFYVASGPDGAVYPIYPLAQILLPAPFYAAGKRLAGIARERPEEVVRMAYSSVNVLAGALLCVVVLWLGRQLGYTPRAAVATALLAGSATMLWAYAQGTFADLPLTLFFCASVPCLLKAAGVTGGDRGARHAAAWLIAAGLLHGLAVLVRPAGLLLLVPSLLYLRSGGWRSWIAFLAPLGALVALAVCVDAAVLGRPLAASYAGLAAADPPRLTPSYGLSLFGLLFSDGRGLFVLSPALLLAIAAFPSFSRRWPREARLFAGHLAVLALFFAAFEGWHGGWSWGPRYLLPCVPLVAVVAGHGLLAGGALRKALTAALVAASLWIQVLSVAVPHRIYMTAVSLHEADLTHFFFYPRFSPVLVHQRILLHKLAGGSEVYALRDLLGLPVERQFDATVLPREPISRYSAGFRSFAWVRVFEKGHRLAAIAAALGCLGSMGLGVWLLRRSARPREPDHPPPPLRNTP